MPNPKRPGPARGRKKIKRGRPIGARVFGGSPPKPGLGPGLNLNIHIDRGQLGGSKNKGKVVRKIKKVESPNAVAGPKKPTPTGSSISAGRRRRATPARAARPKTRNLQTEDKVRLFKY